MIVNLTQHAPTPDQIAAGVVDLPPEKRGELVKLLGFEGLPTTYEVEQRAGKIVALCTQLVRDLSRPPEYQIERERPLYPKAMIGGAPYLMGPLEIRLRRAGIKPLYSFSVRQSVEETLPDGSVKKSVVFRHAGWVPGCTVEQEEPADYSAGCAYGLWGNEGE